MVGGETTMIAACLCATLITIPNLYSVDSCSARPQTCASLAEDVIDLEVITMSVQRKVN